MTTTTGAGVTGIDATYYLTKDVAAATAFYSQLLGAEPTFSMPSIAEWTLADGSAFGLYQPEDAAHVLPSGDVLFHVADIETAVGVAEAHGATIHGREETPGCTMAFGNDPQGNRFILHRHKA